MSNSSALHFQNSLRALYDEPPVTSMMRRLSGMFDRYMERERKFAVTTARSDKLQRAQTAARLRELLLNGYTRVQASRELGISKTSVNRLLDTGASFRVQLTTKVREQVLDLRARGFSQTEIASLVGVSPTTVSRVYRGGVK